MSLVKYRLKEVAADFGMPAKDIAEVISKFYEKPKSNTQVLTEEELNVVFDYFTQTHQIKSLEQVFAVQPAPKAEPVKEEASAAETASALTHTVKEGEDTVSIAIMYGVSPSAVMDLNDLKNTDSLKVGQVLKLPANAKIQ